MHKDHRLEVGFSPRSDASVCNNGPLKITDVSCFVYRAEARERARIKSWDRISAYVAMKGYGPVNRTDITCYVSRAKAM